MVAMASSHIIHFMMRVEPQPENMKTFLKKKIFMIIKTGRNIFTLTHQQIIAKRTAGNEDMQLVHMPSSFERTHFHIFAMGKM